MVLPNNDPPVPPTPGPGPTPPAPTPPPQPPEDYEARFKGLQRTYDALQKKLDAAEDQRTKALADAEVLRQSDSQRQAALDKLQKDLDAIKAEKEAVATQLSSQAALLARKSLILTEFSDLASFEAGGLLPPATTEEEMRTVFTKFREAYQKSVGEEVARKVQMAGPAPTSNLPPAARSKEQVYARLTQLAGSRPGSKDREEYDALLGQWDEMNKSS